MGEILSSRLGEGGKVIFEVQADYAEATQLQGHMSNIILVAQDAAMHEASMTKRGRACATTYFLVPRRMRKSMRYDSRVTCKKIENEGRTVFVYVLHHGNQGRI